MGMNETNDRKQEGPYKGVETQGKGRQSLTMGDRKWHKIQDEAQKIQQNKKELICEESNNTYFLKPK